MAKEIVFDVEARDRLKKGVDALANAVKATLGAEIAADHRRAGPWRTGRRADRRRRGQAPRGSE